MQAIDQRADDWPKQDAWQHGDERARGERRGGPVCFGDPPDQRKSRKRAADASNGLTHPKYPKAGDPVS